jgi:hypothetical protein
MDNGSNYNGTSPVLPSGEWGTSYVFVFTSGALKIQPPQFSYKSSESALSELFTENFIIEPSILQNGVLVGYIIAKQGTLQSAPAIFVAASKFTNTNTKTVGTINIDNKLAINGLNSMEANLNFGNNRGVNIAEPTDLNDAATKNYVDIEISSVGIQNVYDNSITKILTINNSEPLVFNTLVSQIGSSPFKIKYESNGSSGSGATQILYNTGTQSNVSNETSMIISLDNSISIGGDANAITILNTEGSSTVYGIKYGATVNPILQLSGTFEDPSTNTLDINGTLVSVNSLNGVDLFVAENDYIIISHNNKFAEVEFLLFTISDTNILPIYEYSSGTGPLSWTIFSPIDSTDGFTNSGNIIWNLDNLSGWIQDAGDYKIKITRIANIISTYPQLNNTGIQIVETNEYSWNKFGDLLVNSIDTSDFALSGVPVVATAADINRLPDATTNPTPDTLVLRDGLGNIPGNSNTSTTLLTPRTINTVLFDGSANIETPLTGCSDVIITSPIVNDSLRYNGTNWVNDNRCYLSATLNLNQIVTADPVLILYNVENPDECELYNPLNGRYTATVAGLYNVYASNGYTLINNNTYIRTSVYKNGAVYKSSILRTGTLNVGDFASLSVNCVVQLQPTDYISIYAVGDGTWEIPTSPLTFLQIYKL